MKLNTFKNYVRARKYFRLYSGELKPGVYRIREDLRTIALGKDYSSLAINSSRRTGTPKLKTVLLSLFGLMLNFHFDSKNTATVLYLSNDSGVPKHIRLFDYSNNIIKVFCSEKRFVDSSCEIYRQVGSFFNLPAVLDVNGNCYTEEIILSKKTSLINKSDKKRIIEQLLKMYTEFFKSNCWEQDKNEYTQIEDVLEMGFSDSGKWKTVPQHNDLSINNVLLGYDGKCHIIDWEHFGYNIFYYDIFRLMINEAQVGRDSYYLHEYFKGNYDLLLNELFSSVKNNFDPSKRKQYLWNTYTRMVDMSMQNGGSEQDWKVRVDEFDHIVNYIITQQLS